MVIMNNLNYFEVSICKISFEILKKKKLKINKNLCCLKNNLVHKINIF